MDISSELLWKNISELPFFRAFLRAVEGQYLRDIDIQEPVLDLGCGDGHFGSRTLNNYQISGVDPSFKLLLEAKGYHFYQYLINSQGSELPFPDNWFSTIISNSVLEHIKDIDSVIAECYRILSNEGIFVATFPNNNFSDNLSIAIFFEKNKCRKMANLYKKLFNRISRHYHTDHHEKWIKRFHFNGFEVIKTWNYFPPESLKILEWGHFFGLPAWLNKKVFNRWVLFPSPMNILLQLKFKILQKRFLSDQRCINGAYTFIIARKR